MLEFYYLKSRGVAMEGFGSIISALTGACHGTTSYSNMMGFITYTGVRDGDHHPYWDQL